MNKTLLATALVAAMAATSAQAATVVGFKLGGDLWLTDNDGTFAADNGAPQAVDYDSSTQGSVWVAIEHPLPFVPNLLLRENRLESSGSLANADFSFKGNAFSGTLVANTDISNTDFILYYELLDNDLVTLDLGGAYKQLHGSLSVADAGHPERQDIDSGVLMGYASGKVGVPGVGLYAFVDVLSGLSETRVYDYSLGLGWEFKGVALDYHLRGGYRYVNFDVSNFSGVSTDLEFDGYFAGLEIDF
jgi:outer membrane protein